MSGSCPMTQTTRLHEADRTEPSMSWTEPVLRAQRLAAARPTGVQDLPAGFGRHSCAKPVAALAHKVRRLKRPLHDKLRNLGRNVRLGSEARLLFSGFGPVNAAEARICNKDRGFSGQMLQSRNRKGAFLTSSVTPHQAPVIALFWSPVPPDLLARTQPDP